MPVGLLVVFGSLPVFFEHQTFLGAGLTLFDVYIPVLIVLATAAVAFFSLVTPLPTYREQGILRRLSTTPAPRAWVLAAQLIVNACLAATALIIILIVSFAGFGLNAPKSPGGLILVLVLSIAAPFAYALWIASFARTAAAAGGLGYVSFFPMMFFAGLWVPRAELPGALQGIGNFTPLGAAVQALQDAIETGFPPAQPLLVLLAYFVVFCALAVRFFRWE
jgi:ABC-2 type transport system permease protein